MATKKENLDIVNEDIPQETPPSGENPYESPDPKDWVPPMTVRVYPIQNPRSKLLATANVNETVKVTAVKTEPYEEKDRVVRFTADVTVNDTENMTVSGKCQFDEDGKVSFIELDTNELEMTLIANDNADPTQKPPANGNAITLNE